MAKRKTSRKRSYSPRKKTYSFSLIVFGSFLIISMMVMLGFFKNEIKEKFQGVEGANVQSIVKDTRPCGFYGDVNSDFVINQKDADIIKLMINKQKIPTGSIGNLSLQNMRRRAHVTWNGSESDRENVNSRDLQAILQYISSKNSSLFTACKFTKRLTSTCFVGDVDADRYVSLLDSDMVTDSILGRGVKVGLNTADVNADGKVNTLDASQIKQFVMGAPISFKRACTTPAPTRKINPTIGVPWYATPYPTKTPTPAR